MHKAQREFLIMGLNILHLIIEKEVVVLMRFLQDELGAGLVRRLREIVRRDGLQLLNLRQIGGIEVLLKVVQGIKKRRVIIMRCIQVSKHHA